MRGGGARGAYLEAVADAAQHVGGGHGHVLVVDLGGVGALDAHLVLGRARRHAAERALHDERRHLPGPRVDTGRLRAGALPLCLHAWMLRSLKLGDGV